MPPKAKFSKEEIVGAALEIVKREGADALTARSLAEELHSSPRPIFTVFKSIEEVRSEVLEAARKSYERFEDEGMDGDNPFKGSGMGYLRYAAKYPKLFQLLFMRESESVPDMHTVLGMIDRYHDKIVVAIEKSYGFDSATAREIYLHGWIYTHGIATLIATNVCKFTEEETSRMLTEAVGSIIIKYLTEYKK